MYKFNVAIVQLTLPAMLLLASHTVAAQAAQPAADPPGDSLADSSPSVEEIARLRQNPVSGLRQVYFQAEVAPDSPPSGDTEGAYSLQAVWPVALPTPDYKLITYSILPVLQIPESPSGDTTWGMGNVVLNGFVAPTKTENFVWGLGATAVLPTRSKDTLGSDRFGAGPAAVLFYAQQAWSAGVVLQNVWSLGGSGINEVNDFAAQYFLNYNFSDGWFIYSNSTVTADWTADSSDRWTVPVGLGAGKVFTIGKQSVSVTLQGVSNVVRPDHTADWGLNFQFTFMFP